MIKHLPTYQWVKQSCTKYYSGQSYVANSYIKLLVGANKHCNVKVINKRERGREERGREKERGESERKRERREGREREREEVGEERRRGEKEREREKLQMHTHIS